MFRHLELHEEKFYKLAEKDHVNIITLTWLEFDWIWFKSNNQTICDFFHSMRQESYCSHLSESTSCFQSKGTEKFAVLSTFRCITFLRSCSTQHPGNWTPPFNSFEPLFAHQASTNNHSKVHVGASRCKSQTSFWEILLFQLISFIWAPTLLILLTQTRMISWS